MTHPPEPPVYPGEEPVGPSAGGAAGPPVYPSGAPTYPADGPAYPGAEPTYPAGGPPPAYPVAASDRPPVEGPSAPAPGPDEDDLDFQQGRLHLGATQRRADAATWSSLVFQLPAFVISLVLVSLLAYLVFDSLAWLFVLAWLASGALVFHRPTESAFARQVLRLRYPTPQERARLEPVWTEVTRRAGVYGSTYELWIDERDAVNAMASAGHIVGVTGRSLRTLPNSQLAAVLAHELGHHTSGHAWSTLLGYWYGLPARGAWAAARGVTFKLLHGSGSAPLAGGCLMLMLGCGILSLLISAWWLVLPAAIAPFALAWASRKAELSADEHAAKLGFAPMLAEVLKQEYEAEQAAAATPPPSAEPQAPPGPYGRPGPHHVPGPYGPPGQYGGPPPHVPHQRPQPKTPQPPSGLVRLLTTHPEYHTRLHHLQPYLDGPG
ncbi:M48 family metalloprotease [Streptomyces sp. DSM 42041]|uniref:M48 family metalloprotease n=1 Tax=Streptomyces hazeniae TaxID=3075538 RepID=A0ABU2NYG6_9ACTN|nr:M48 family metalloprotease [Streptomyces sp. DSM 42041]MDT0382035.1 M48 family metalloprotease [Streptomyces sp. DSM 42041]